MNAMLTIARTFHFPRTTFAGLRRFRAIRKFIFGHFPLQRSYGYGIGSLLAVLLYSLPMITVWAQHPTDSAIYALKAGVENFPRPARDRQDTVIPIRETGGERKQRQQLQEVQINAYLEQENLFTLPGAVALIDQSERHLQNANSLIPVLNTVPGVSAEERSPGSYRLSLRGSLLRSPYGVRDIKVYLDEIPLTDAGGNTYLNAIDPAAQDNIVILKGPDGSLFGANTGGVLRLLPFSQPATDESPAKNELRGGLAAGSYAHFRQFLHYRQTGDRHSLSIKQGYQHDGGYRAQSRMRRHFLQLTDVWRWHPRHQLKILALGSDLHYETPGGLTLAQMQENPRAARPATATLPGAEAQHTGVHTRLLLLGLVQQTQLSSALKNISSVFGNIVELKNPFITNYETRSEKTFGARSYFEWRPQTGGVNSLFNLGVEAQQTGSLVANFDNVQGYKGSQQQTDRLRALQSFIFFRYSARWRTFRLELALSRNTYLFQFKERYPNAEADFSKRHFDPKWMPKVAITYQPQPKWLLRGSISRGYSPPTTAEIRPPGNQINTNLEASSGWNYEAGLRYQSASNRLDIDLSAFYYQMEQAIVRRIQANETEYFINAGGTHQLGFEALASWWLLPQKSSGLLRGLRIREALTLSHFTFHHYQVDQESFSGNRLTGVPDQRFVTSLEGWLSDFTLLLQHRYTASLPLNDGNTTWAEPFHLLFARITWQTRMLNSPVAIFAWGANLLNTRYSAGHDLNAFGGRYYNPAPGRHFSLGLTFTL